MNMNEPVFKIGDIVKWGDSEKPFVAGYVIDISIWNDEWDYHICWFKNGNIKRHRHHVLAKVEE